MRDLEGSFQFSTNPSVLLGVETGSPHLALAVRKLDTLYMLVLQAHSVAEGEK